MGDACGHLAQGRKPVPEVLPGLERLQLRKVGKDKQLADVPVCAVLQRRDVQTQPDPFSAAGEITYLCPFNSLSPAEQLSYRAVKDFTGILSAGHRLASFPGYALQQRSSSLSASPGQSSPLRWARSGGYLHCISLWTRPFPRQSS